MDFKLELIVIPVSDVDKVKDFYTDNAGFHLDVDHRAGEDFRVVQLPGPAIRLHQAEWQLLLRLGREGPAAVRPSLPVA